MSDNNLTKKIHDLEKQNEKFREEFKQVSVAMEQLHGLINQVGTAQNALAMLVDKLSEGKQIITLN